MHTTGYRFHSVILGTARMLSRTKPLLATVTWHAARLSNAYQLL